MFGDIDTADLYVVRVCEISFFLSEILMNFAYPYSADVARLKLDRTSELRPALLE